MYLIPFTPLMCSCSTSFMAGPAVEGVADVVLTREAGKNGDLARRLGDRSIKTLELPLVETGPGPDRCCQ